MTKYKKRGCSKISKLTAIVLLVSLTFTACAPGTREEFLKANSAVLGQFGEAYNFSGKTYKVNGAVKERESFIADVYHTNVILLNLQNSEDDISALNDLYLGAAQNCYAIDKKNRMISGTVFIREHGDYATNLIYACDSNTTFEDIRYFIVKGTVDSNGKGQTLMFPLWDSAEQQLPEKKYKPKAASENGPEITLAEYGQINEGMNYVAVKNIVGSPGELLSEVEVGEFYSKTYIWYGADGISNAVVLFSNGAVSTFSQIGLS